MWLLIANLAACVEGRAAAPAPTTQPIPPTQAETEAHLAAMHLPAGMHAVARAPFVVIGNEPASTVEARADGPLLRSAKLLRTQLFSTDLTDVWEVWLLADAQSYERQTLTMFGVRADTPYGFANGPHHAMVMNIGLGGGTLIHELVHPYVHADFPEAPDWLNEGIASLYEQAAERNGRITGYPNWRLAGLHHGITTGSALSLRALIQSHDDFYTRQGDPYAVARYLCFYLQEHDLLETFYRAFRAGWHADPSGWNTLQTTLGNPDPSQFQRDWEAWVMHLAYDPRHPFGHDGV